MAKPRRTRSLTWTALTLLALVAMPSVEATPMATSSTLLNGINPGPSHAAAIGEDDFHVLTRGFSGGWQLELYQHDAPAPMGAQVLDTLNLAEAGPLVHVAGYTYVFGGLAVNGQPVHTTFRFQAWSGSDFVELSTPIPSALGWQAAAFVYAQQVYLVDCSSPAPCFLHKYSPVSDSWTTLGNELPVWSTPTRSAESVPHATGQIALVTVDTGGPDILAINLDTLQADLLEDALIFPSGDAAVAKMTNLLYIFGGSDTSTTIQQYQYAPEGGWVASWGLTMPTAPGPYVSATPEFGWPTSCIFVFGRQESRIDYAPFNPTGGDCEATEGCSGDWDCDGVSNPNDNCPQAANANQADSDEDGVGNACDSTTCAPPPSQDADCDGVSNTNDNCPQHYNPNQNDWDGDGAGNACDATPGCNPTAADDDCDGVANPNDNCDDAFNPGQEDADGDGIGNACDPSPGCNPGTVDPDCDGVANPNDNCDDVPNPDQTDSDGDGIGNACEPTSPGNDNDGDGVSNPNDNCPYASNPDQADLDGDGVGDACDGDDDGDGTPDGEDNCFQQSNPGQNNTDNDSQGNTCDADDDNDGVQDGSDNCPQQPNSGQADSDQDGLGDACDPPPCATQPCDGSGGGDGGNNTAGGDGSTGGNGGDGGTDGSGDGSGGNATDGPGADVPDGGQGSNTTPGGDLAGIDLGTGMGQTSAGQDGFAAAECAVTDHDCLEKAAILRGEPNQPRSTMVRPDSPALSGPAVAGLTAGGILAVGGLWMGRFRWLAAAIVGLNRLRKKNVLDHPVRLAIMDLTATNPGIHFLQLKREVGTGRGNLEHHLRVLLTAGLVREVKDKGFRCFFKPDPATAETMATAPVVKSTRAKHILNTIDARPGLTMAELAREVGVTYRGAAYHVERLHGAGAANMQHEGGVLRIYPRGAR